MEKFVVDYERNDQNKKMDIAKNMLLIVEEQTEGISDLTNLAIELAAINDPHALKLLQLLVQATTFGKLDKNLKVNCRADAIDEFGVNYETNVIYNLVKNQLYLSKDLLASINAIKKICWGFQPYGVDGLTIGQFMAKILSDIKDPNSLFYKREDIAKKYLEILTYAVAHDEIHFKDIKKYLDKFNREFDRDLNNFPFLMAKVDSVYSASYSKINFTPPRRDRWFAEDFANLTLQDMVYTQNNVQRLIRENK